MCMIVRIHGASRNRQQVLPKLTFNSKMWNGPYLWKHIVHVEIHTLSAVILGYSFKYVSMSKLLLLQYAMLLSVD